MAAKHFSMMAGLRGCYMPDSVYVLKCASRRELKEIVRDELTCAEKKPSQRALAQYVAEVWRRHKEPSLPLVMPTNKEQSYGIHLSYATRSEYEELIDAD
jgi:hypothetical protein